MRNDPTVTRKLLDIDEREPVCFEDLANRREREIGEVLVIHGVVFEMLDESCEMRKLEGGGAAGGEQRLDTGDEVVDVWNLSEHVRSRDEVGLVILGNKTFCEGTTEEFRQRLLP